jgi:nitrogen regulatory protein PII
MKQINAYVQPFMADKVTDALRNANVHGVTVLSCRGFGRLAKESGDTLGFEDKIKLEIICADAEKDAVLTTIREHAHTGRHGDGKIVVSTIDEMEDIRTGSKSEDVD